MAVFLTDGLLRKSLSAVRSLGTVHIPVVVGEKTRWTSSGFSKYCKGFYTYPNPEEDPRAFGEWLITHLKNQAYDLFIPMDDATMNVAMSLREELGLLTKVILPPNESFNVAKDKLLTAQLAEKANIPHPRTYSVHSLKELNSLSGRLNYPVIIKPRISSGSRGIKIVYNEKECLQSYKTIHQIYSYPFIQEYIPLGPRYDVCFLYNTDGDLRAQFVQKECRHFPIDIGPSTLQTSVEYPELIELSTQFMGHLPWSGIIELEFMVDPRDGIPKLMEVNPRFWNSLECAQISGVNFPVLLYKMATEGDVDRLTHYEVGRKCSNVLVGDTLHFIFNKERRKMDPPFLFSKKQKVCDDILSLKDPLPTFGFFLTVIRYLFDAKMWKLLFNRGGSYG